MATRPAGSTRPTGQETGSIPLLGWTPPQYRLPSGQPAQPATSQTPNFWDILNGNLAGLAGPEVGVPNNSIGRQLTVGGTVPMQAGLASLTELLFRRGQTDPLALNRNISSINRGTEQNVGDIGDEAARRGLSGSGLAMALQNSARGAGASRVAGARADEAARTEDRRRQDLSLLYDLIIGPGLQQAGIAAGVQSQNQDRQLAERQSDKQQQAAMLAALGAILGACWVARAVYGERDPRWLLARRWMLTLAPAELLERYLAYGPALAEWVKRSPRLRRLLRPAFDRMVAEVS